MLSSASNVFFINIAKHKGLDGRLTKTVLSPSKCICVKYRY